MKSQSNNQSGRRQRRGRRRRPSGGSITASTSMPKAPPTLLERILSFFRGGRPKKALPATPAKTTVPAAVREVSPPKARVSRKPELVEVTSPRLYVGNLSFDATESDLTELFNGVGQVRNAEVVSHKYTQRSKGFAFVQMATTEEARRAVQELHDKEFLGRKLVVSGAKTPDAERERAA